MKFGITLALTLIISVPAFAKAQIQATNCDCAKDLIFISKKLEGTPSYKKQIVGTKQVEYQTTLERLLSESIEPISLKDCFLKLQELSNTIQDKHVSIRQAEEVFNSDDYETETAIKAFRQTAAFQNHPTAHKNIAEITSQLKELALEQLEGIYNYGNDHTVGIYKTGVKTYEGVVLSSKNGLWDPGQILVSLTGIGNDMYDVVYYGLASRKLYMSKGQYHSPGRLFAMRKVALGTDHSKAPTDLDNWHFKQLNDKIQYIRMATFGNSSENKKAFHLFLEKIKDKLTADNIVIDLRSNGGGNKKYSDPFIKYLKKSKAAIYVMTNPGTASNAEQFTVKLKKQINAIQVGMRTNGTIAYGLNYGRSYTTPTGLFKIMPTDMNFHNRFFQYEYVGVQPDIQLDNSRDWIDQLNVIIASRNL